MNLFRSEEHLKRWPLFFETVDDYVMPVADWSSVFSASMFRQRLEPDFLARAPEYVEDYRRALKEKGKRAPAPDRILSTVMFTDIVDSTGQAARAGDTIWRSQLERHNDVVRNRIEHFEGREIKQTGDGFMAAFDGPTRAIRCASAICESMRDLGLRVRAGIHTGECEVIGDDLSGIAVHIAARLTEAAAPSEVLVSRTAREAVTGSNINFDDRGRHTFRGVPGEWDAYAVSA